MTKMLAIEISFFKIINVAILDIYLVAFSFENICFAFAKNTMAVHSLVASEYDSPQESYPNPNGELVTIISQMIINFDNLTM